MTGPITPKCSSYEVGDAQLRGRRGVTYCYPVGEGGRAVTLSERGDARLRGREGDVRLYGQKGGRAVTHVDVQARVHNVRNIVSKAL